MDLQARPLQYFVAVARERSFSRAAARLHVSQPSLSAQLRELERRLGFALFERTSRHVALTREGRLFLADAQRMVAEAARLNRAAREIRESELRLAAAIYTVLIPERTALTERFAAAHPEIRLHMDNPTQVQQFIRLRRGELDIAIVIGLAARSAEAAGPDTDALSEIVLPGDFERLDILARPVRLLVPRESPLAALDPVPLDRLAGTRVAMLGAYHGAELIDAISLPLLEAGVDLDVPAEGNAISVERHGALARLPAVSLGWFAYGQDTEAMVARRVEGLDVTTELALLRLQRSDRRPALDSFWTFAQDFARALA
ncbi:MAG: LysR family transcriptional regulator [Alphaproteobacteria bacterium]|nr:LysR family transcriptional regulator [Alphaproteobacteria bacterium]